MAPSDKNLKREGAKGLARTREMTAIPIRVLTASKLQGAASAITVGRDSPPTVYDSISWCNPNTHRLLVCCTHTLFYLHPHDSNLCGLRDISKIITTDEMLSGSSRKQTPSSYYRSCKNRENKSSMESHIHSHNGVATLVPRATSTSKGVDFSLFSEHARGVEALFVRFTTTKRETKHIHITRYSDHVASVCGECTRASNTDIGAWTMGPARGHRLTRTIVLFDPYAHSIGRDLNWGDAVFGY